MLRTSLRKLATFGASSSAMRTVMPIVSVPAREVKVTADQLRNGHLIEWEGKRMAVTGFKAAMMGRRPTSLHIDLKDVVTGKSFPQRFSPSDRVERIELENNDYQYLYTEGDISYAMHPVSFEQIEFDSKLFGDGAVHYAQPDSPVTISFYQGKVFSISVPDYAFVRVTDTEFYSAEKSGPNDQAPKPAVLANGRTVKVTRFVNNGDLVKIKVDGEEFVSRATEEEAKAYQERYLSKTIMRG